MDRGKIVIEAGGRKIGPDEDVTLGEEQNSQTKLVEFVLKGKKHQETLSFGFRMGQHASHL